MFIIMNGIVSYFVASWYTVSIFKLLCNVKFGIYIWVYYDAEVTRQTEINWKVSMNGYIMLIRWLCEFINS